MRGLDRKGTISFIIILFVLIFSALAVTSEVALLQRVEGKRYATRNNGIYTADAMLDLYIYRTQDLFAAAQINFIVTPLTSQTTYEMMASDISEALTDEVEGRIHLKTPDILDILSALEIDQAYMRNAMMDIVSDQLIVQNTVINSQLYQLDWEGAMTDIDLEAGGTISLQPIRVEFTTFFKSYTVKKVVLFSGIFVEVYEDNAELHFTINDDTMSVFVEEYSCYE